MRLAERTRLIEVKRSLVGIVVNAVNLRARRTTEGVRT